MKTETEWLASEPLSTVNKPAWVRAIQADALDHAARYGTSAALSKIEELKAWREESVCEKEIQFERFVELACAYRTTLEEIIEGFAYCGCAREKQRLKEVTALLNEIQKGRQREQG